MGCGTSAPKEKKKKKKNAKLEDPIISRRNRVDISGIEIDDGRAEVVQVENWEFNGEELSGVNVVGIQRENPLPVPKESKRSPTDEKKVQINEKKTLSTTASSSIAGDEIKETKEEEEKQANDGGKRDLATTSLEISTPTTHDIDGEQIMKSQKQAVQVEDYSVASMFDKEDLVASMFDDEYKDENEAAAERLKVAETETKPIAEVNIKPEEIKLDKKNKVETHSDFVKHESEAKLEPEVEMEGESEPEPDKDPKPEIETEPKSETETEPKPETETEPKLETETEPKPEEAKCEPENEFEESVSFIFHHFESLAGDGYGLKKLGAMFPSIQPMLIHFLARKLWHIENLKFYFTLPSKEQDLETVQKFKSAIEDIQTNKPEVEEVQPELEEIQLDRKPKAEAQPDVKKHEPEAQSESVTDVV